ncbi:MAG: hypothetical protein NZ700_01990 [Gemmataceae bacterium]|nr:hypothetical protein [Gemmataceae bacterium]MDW8265973.1 hypothetical protein [Gemmataceae bacterium]
MVSPLSVDLDMIEELRLRRWARENYVPRAQRQASWHPVILEEMSKKDRDLGEDTTSPAYGGSKS